MSIQVKELAFIFHAVTDVARARKFYEGVLGLKASLEFVGPEQAWIEYDIAGQALAISNAMPVRPSGALALEVADLDAALATARAAGVKVTLDPLEFPPCRMFQVEDPDGNGITLHQRKAQT
jgi:predicted enzyme related to lactoylglutathione lyase